FQAEDGIRDKLVTGVQTCALPISRCSSRTAACARPWSGGCCRCCARDDTPCYNSVTVLSHRFRVKRRMPTKTPKATLKPADFAKIGRASCRERVWICAVVLALETR